MMKIPLYPEYGMVAKLIPLFDGIPVQTYKSMWNTIRELMGTPQNPVDWRDPDKWIPERLSGSDRELATKIWEKSKKTVNPRRVNEAMFILCGYSLIEDRGGVYVRTADGREFTDSPENAVVQHIDMEEGLIQILRQISLITRGKRSDLLEEWREYTKYNSNLRQEVVIKEYLRRRLLNLVDRGYVSREGNTYTITEKGIGYLRIVEQSNPDGIGNRETEMRSVVESFRKEQRVLLRDYLAKAKPYEFEKIIKDLLTSMGYEDVEVTSPTNDKGVDVVGVIQIGITTVREVVQVKRKLSGNVQRPDLDNMRGCLHRFNAFQSTIITLSDFAKGAKSAAFETGAAPITLINGDKLIDLLISNEVGVERRSADYFVVDESYFDRGKEVPKRSSDRFLPIRHVSEPMEETIRLLSDAAYYTG